MICRHCGKKCPEGTKFCIFCGEVLEDPDKKFMGKTFGTVEECNTVKRDYQMLTQKFSSNNVSYTMEEVESATRECQTSSKHPAAIQLATSLLDEIAEDIRFKSKRKKRLGKVRVLAFLYITITLFLMCIEPVIWADGNWYTLPGMLVLLIPGKLGFVTWLLNAVVVVGISFAILISLRLYFMRKEDREFATLVPFIIPLFLIPIFILTIIPPLFFKVDFNYGDSFFMSIVPGLFLGLVCCCIMPTQPKKKTDDTSIKNMDK